MSTHTIGLLLAILGGCVPLAKPLPWRIVLTIPPSQTFLFTLLGQNLLAQTPAPSSFPEDRPTPEPTPAVKKPRVTQGSQWRLCGRKQNASQRSSGFTGDTTGTYISNIQVNLYTGV